VRKFANLFWTLFMLHHHGNLSSDLWQPWDGVTRNFINTPGVKTFIQTQFHIEAAGMEAFRAYCEASWASDSGNVQTFLGATSTR